MAADPPRGGVVIADGDYELVTADEARLARAWSRCKAALPEGWGLSLLQTARPGDGRWLATAIELAGPLLGQSSLRYGPDEAAALDALALALEARQP